MKIKMEWQLPATIKKKGKWYVSSCPLLDVYSQGRTREEARRNIVDALASFLMSCYERGTLDAVLRDAGLVAVAQATVPEVRLPAKFFSVKVPLPFEIKARRGKRPAAAAA
jgi:predicted RNase H-like HicB family nuclease